MAGLILLLAAQVATTVFSAVAGYCFARSREYRRRAAAYQRMADFYTELEKVTTRREQATWN